MPGYLDRRRASRLLKNDGLAALVLCQPESIVYAAGAFPGVATFWRRAGAAFLVVPVDEDAPLSAIVGDLQSDAFANQSGIADTRSHRIWVERDIYPFDTAKPVRMPRPAQFDFAASLALLHDVLRERNCQMQQVGLELGFVPVADFQAFEALPYEWRDATRVVERLRSIKQPEEISLLRRAAAYSAAGIVELAQRISPGMTAGTMTKMWKEAAYAEAAGRREQARMSDWSYIAVGRDGFGPGDLAKEGDIIKVDVGCVLNGYSSDGARSLVLGEPSREAQDVHDALHHAFEEGIELFKPGKPLCEIYAAVASSVWRRGYESYGRGHFGHGVGSSIWSEEWPFISQDSDATLEAGMVMAFETPWYIDGLGGFIIEDQLLITETGHEVMSLLPRHLLRAGTNPLLGRS